MIIRDQDDFRNGLVTLKHTLFKRILEKIKINEKGCWVFTGYVDPKTSYGQIRIRCFGRTRLFKVHRFVAYYIYGLDLFDLKLDACHDCDTRNCVNPLHIWVGTRSENFQNAAAKGRWHNQYHNNLKTQDWNVIPDRKVG